MICMVDLHPLLAAYKSAKRAFNAPCASISVDVEGEEIILALVHPKTWETMLDGVDWDPRGTTVPLHPQIPQETEPTNKLPF